MALLLAMLAVTATCTPSASLANAGPERVRAYFDAINARNEAAIGRFLLPGATYSNPQVQGIPLAEVMTMLVATPEAERLDVVEATASPSGVLVRTRTPSGSTASALVQVDGGCIRRFSQAP